MNNWVVDLWIIKEENDQQYIELVIQDSKVIIIWLCYVLDVVWVLNDVMKAQLVGVAENHVSISL